MSKKVPIYWMVISGVLVAAITFSLSYIAAASKYNTAMQQAIKGQTYSELYTIENIVKNNYDGELSQEDLKNAVFRGYVAGIGDKYASYMTPEELSEYLGSVNGNSVGIGVDVTYSAEHNAIEIVNVALSSPADSAGLCGGDIIVRIDGKSVTEIGYYSAISLMKGDKGSSVTLTVLREGREFEITCIRDVITLTSVGYHIYRGTTDIGVIRIEEFNSTTPDQLKAAVESLKTSGCDRLVFDVRNNPGGDLESVCKVLDYLLPEGPIIHIYYANGREEHRNSDAQCLDIPCAVLVNNVTASAAELFTAALRDYTESGDFNATVVGTKTYGKGVLQSIYSLPNGGALKITTAHYDPPYSKNYNEEGISPNVEVKLSEEASKLNFYKLDDYNDNQLIAACEELSNL